jgi:protein involved in polysaccharide export with SLBB domain
MNKFGLYKFLLVITLLFGNIYHAISQDLLKGKDLSKLKVDMISSSDLAKLKSQLSASGISIEQAEQIAISKGMSIEEAFKLRQKLSENQPAQNGKSVTKVNNERENSEPESLEINTNIKDGSLINPLIYGSELYSLKSLSFEPNLKLATPINYILGPTDQILVTIYGVQEMNENLTVSPDGIIVIPNVGEVKVAGLTIEAVTQRLKNVLGNGIYPYLKTGGAKLSVTLSKIRTISITVIGSNRPGNYKVSSFASVFNALFIAGGPSEFGSFREIELIRNNKVERKIDLYRFLHTGDQSDNIGLKDNDVIRIPVYKKRVEFRGEFKRPGIFEVLPGESFAKILEYTSGFTDFAYTNSIKVYKRDQKQRVIKDLYSNEFNTYQPSSGEAFEAKRIVNKYINRIKISGAVYRPDSYELTNQMRVGDLIKRSDGIRKEAYTELGQIFRQNADSSNTILSFDVIKAINGDQEHDISLVNDDSVVIKCIDPLNSWTRL